MNLKKPIIIALLQALYTGYGYAETKKFTIEIKNHLFYPAEVIVPAEEKVKLLIINHDQTPEEFESFELNREKVILGNRRGIVFIGPIDAGEYTFFGEFYPETAQGKIIVKQEKP